MVENQPKVIATANSTLTGSIPLKIYVTEKLTNVSIELNTEEAIYVDIDSQNTNTETNVQNAEEGEETQTKQVLRESQNIDVKIASYDFASNNDIETGLKEKYQCEKLIEMLNNNKLEFVIINADDFATSDNQNTFGIYYNIINNSETKQIQASLLIPLVTNFNPANTNVPQKLIKDITIKLQLTEETKLEYGEQADNFEIGEIKIDVQTARAKSISLTSNALQETLYSNDMGDVKNECESANYVKYIQGQWVIDKPKTDGASDGGATAPLEVYAQFNPLKTAKTDVKIESSNEALLKINEDNNSITSDIDEELNKEYKYKYSAQLSFQKPSSTDSYSYVYIKTSETTYTPYKYIGKVVLTFTTTDSNYKIEDESGKLRDVYAEIEFHLIAAIETQSE